MQTDRGSGSLLSALIAVALAIPRVGLTSEVLFDDFEHGDLFAKWSTGAEGWSLVDGAACQDGNAWPLESRMTFATGEDLFATVEILHTNVAEVGGAVVMAPLAYISDDFQQQHGYAAMIVGSGDGTLTAEIHQVVIDYDAERWDVDFTSFPISEVPTRFGLEVRSSDLRLWVDGALLGTAPRIVFDRPFTTGRVTFGNGVVPDLETCFDDIEVVRSLETACDATASWRNHGAYVSCVARETQAWVAAGVITHDARAALVRDAAQSKIGR